jgi:hypothetical protein
MGKLQDILQQNLEQQIQDKISIDKLNTFNIPDISDLIPSDLQLSAKDKLSKLPIEKINQLKSQVEDKINTTLSQLQQSAKCPTEKTLNTILNVRDGILSKINTTVNTLNKTKKGLEFLKQQLDLQTKAINTATDIKTVAQLTKSAGIIAQGLLPIVPGEVASAIDIADTTIQISDDIIKFLQFDTLGTQKILPLKTQLSTSLLYIDLSSQALLPLVDKLKSIDSILKKCGKKVTPISTDITTFISISDAVNQENTLINYQGFILDIIEKPFGNNLTQKIGVAKDSQGVVLLQTPPSFTTNPQTLISELKYLITRDNLKAN